ncbi:MAG: hypothetical protein AABY22_00605 [Nanoarchaeota archaeon]
MIKINNKWEHTLEEIERMKNHGWVQKKMGEVIKLYQENSKNMSRVAKILNCSVPPIKRILNEQGIDTSLKNKPKWYREKLGFKVGHKINLGRKHPIGHKTGKGSKGRKRPDLLEYNKKRIGEKSPMWKGGIQYEPYDKGFNKKFKSWIRKRDNYLCLKCGIHQEKLSKTLAIHHIDYNKKLTILENCCALCNKCNSEVNFNRPHWTKFFQSLLAERYGYQYSEDGKIILNIGEEIYLK